MKNAIIRVLASSMSNYPPLRMNRLSCLTITLLELLDFPDGSTSDELSTLGVLIRGEDQKRVSHQLRDGTPVCCPRLSRQVLLYPPQGRPLASGLDIAILEASFPAVKLYTS